MFVNVWNVFPRVSESDLLAVKVFAGAGALVGFGARLNSCFAGRGGAACITLALPNVLIAGFSSSTTGAAFGAGLENMSSISDASSGSLSFGPNHSPDKKSSPNQTSSALNTIESLFFGFPI